MYYDLSSFVGCLAACGVQGCSLWRVSKDDVLVVRVGGEAQKGVVHSEVSKQPREERGQCGHQEQGHTDLGV